MLEYCAALFTTVSLQKAFPPSKYFNIGEKLQACRKKEKHKTLGIVNSKLSSAI